MVNDMVGKGRVTGAGRPREAALYGREAELQLFRRQMALVVAGEPGVLLVSGEPGSGKTRLLQEFSRLAKSEGWLTLHGRSVETQGMPPYLSFTEALGQYLTRLPDDAAELLVREAPGLTLLLPGWGEQRRSTGLVAAQDGDRYGFFQDVLACLRYLSSQQNLLLCIDDLHWADDSTHALLLHIAERLEGRILLVVAHRSSAQEGPLLGTLAELARLQIGHRVAIAPLSEAETRALTADLAGEPPNDEAVAAVYHQTQGNPFFVTEVVRGHLASGARLEALRQRPNAPLPETVQQVLARRLSGLDDTSRELLQCASVIGDGFTPELAAEVSGHTASDAVDAFETLMAQGMLKEDGTQFVFAHPLIRRVTYDRLSLPRRQRLHHLIAETYERLHGESESTASEIAFHYREGGRAEYAARSARFAELAGDGAMRRFAWEDAHLSYEAALNSLPATGENDAKRCELLVSFAVSLRIQGQAVEALRWLEDAYELAQKLGDRRLKALVCDPAIFCQRDLNFRSEASPGSADAATWVARMDDVAEPDSLDRINADLALSHIAAIASRNDEFWRLVQQALNLVRQLGCPIEAMAACNWILGMPRPPAARADWLALVQEITPKLDHIPHRLVRSNLLRSCAAVYLENGDGDMCDAMWARADSDGRDLNTGPGVSSPDNETARLTRAGRLHEALESTIVTPSPGADDVASSQTVSPLAIPALTFLGRFQALEEVARLNFSGMAAARARALIGLGRKGEARSSLRSLVERLGVEIEGSVVPLYGLVDMLDLAVMLEDRDLVEIMVPRLMPAGNVISQLYRIPMRSSSRVIGDAAVFLGDPEGAIAHYEAAVEICERARFRPEAAISRLAMGRTLARHFPRRHQEAMDHLKLAETELRAMDMQPSLVEAQDLLARLQRRRTGRKAYPAGLSAREVEVLRLIAMGRTNQQISDELVISLNTVTHHVTNVLTKSGSANRTEAAAFAHREGLV